MRKKLLFLQCFVHLIEYCEFSRYCRARRADYARLLGIFEPPFLLLSFYRVAVYCKTVEVSILHRIADLR